MAAAVLVMWSVASPMATPGFRLKKSVTLVNWLMWFTACGPSVVFQSTSLERDEVLPVVRPDVQARDPPDEPCRVLDSRMTWYWSVGFLIR